MFYALWGSKAPGASRGILSWMGLPIVEALIGAFDLLWREDRVQHDRRVADLRGDSRGVVALARRVAPALICGAAVIVPRVIVRVSGMAVVMRGGVVSMRRVIVVMHMS